VGQTGQGFDFDLVVDFAASEASRVGGPLEGAPGAKGPGEGSTRRQDPLGLRSGKYKEGLRLFLTHVRAQVYKTIRVTPFVVVPAKDLDQRTVHLGELGIVRARSRVANNVR
jgi:hypothetical protein